MKQYNFYTKPGDTHDYHYVSATPGVKADSVGGMMLLMRDESFYIVSAAVISLNQNWHGMDFESACYWNEIAGNGGIVFG